MNKLQKAIEEIERIQDDLARQHARERWESEVFPMLSGVRIIAVRNVWNDTYEMLLDNGTKITFTIRDVKLWEKKGSL